MMKTNNLKANTKEYIVCHIKGKDSLGGYHGGFYYVQYSTRKAGGEKMANRSVCYKLAIHKYWPGLNPSVVFRLVASYNPIDVIYSVISIDPPALLLIHLKICSSV